MEEKEKSLDAKLVKLFKDSEGQHISGEELSRKLGVSRTAVWKHIEHLREVGYELRATPHLGYLYEGSPDKILVEEIHYYLKTRWLGKNVAVFQSLDSTNRMALEGGQKKASHGQVFFAEKQTQGRGRRGRHWVSPEGRGLYFSLILKPDLELQEISKITLTAAVAVAKTLRKMTRVPAMIRWPNDILVGSRKLCGILTEVSAEQDQISYAVLGIGVNVNGSLRSLPDVATTLEHETQRRWDRNLLTAELFLELERCYEKLESGGWQELLKQWEAMSMISGERITVTTLHQTLSGRAIGVDENGALLLSTDDGAQHRVLSGDVMLCR